MTASNQPGLQQETLSGSPLRESYGTLASFNTDLLCHQQQEQQNEQQSSEDSCTSGSKAKGRSDEVEPQQQLQQNEESTSAEAAAELAHFGNSKFSLLMDQMLMHEREQGSGTRFLASRAEDQRLVAMAAHRADQVPRAAGMQREPSFVALLEDDTLDPATDLSNNAVREQHADERPYAASAYCQNGILVNSWQRTPDDVRDGEDSILAQGSWGSAQLEDDVRDGKDSVLAQGSWGSAELEDGDSEVENGGLVDGHIGGIGDGDIWDADDGDVWDRFDMEDIEMEEVEDHKLTEEGNAMDNASRPGAGIGAGIGAAASAGGASRLPEGLGAKWQAADTQGFTFSKPSAACRTETSGCGDLQGQTSASIFAYRGDTDDGQTAMSQAEAHAEFWKQGLDEALQRGTATLKALNMRMQHQEADFKACMQRHEADFRAQKQQREAEFKALEEACFANVEATAKLHVEADERAGRLLKRLDISRCQAADLADDLACIKDKKKGLKRQNKGLTQEVKDQQLTITDLQSCLDGCKGSTRALEAHNASLLQRSLDLEQEHTALKEQVQSLQRALTPAHAQQAARSQTELAQAAAAVALLKKQLHEKGSKEAVLKRMLLMMGEQQTDRPE
ncbi:TPA: hypothetical protein ACH3X1_006407 [Trebouxia sp. C0004]